MERRIEQGEEFYAWHFLPIPELGEGFRDQQTGEPVETGVTNRVSGPLVPWRNGLHWSANLFNAMRCGPGGANVSRVRVSGDYSIKDIPGYSRGLGYSTERTALGIMGIDSLINANARKILKETFAERKIEKDSYADLARWLLSRFDHCTPRRYVDALGLFYSPTLHAADTPEQREAAWAMYEAIMKRHNDSLEAQVLKAMGLPVPVKEEV